MRTISFQTEGFVLLDMNLQYGLAAKLATPVVHFRRSLSTSLHSDQ